MADNRSKVIRNAYRNQATRIQTQITGLLNTWQQESYASLAGVRHNLINFTDKVKNLDKQILRNMTKASTFHDSLHKFPARVSITIKTKSKSNFSIST